MDYTAYARSIRRELHQYPEIGFDLPKTLAVVRRELDAMGIPYTEKYGRSSIVATINEGKGHFTIGLRADMDALPVQEPEGCEFRSEIDGQMHACGHDIHTANLLAVARQLKDRQEEFNCCVKLLFTPAEEYITPGCKEMAENGVMDDIDCALALHTDPFNKAGTVIIGAGGINANSMGFTIEFFGTSAHANRQQLGHDAIAMAVQAHTAISQMMSKEFNPVEPRLLNIGAIEGGKTNNIICNYCKMFGTNRTFSDDVSDKIITRVRQICEGIAAMNGGRCEVKVTKYVPYVYNDPVVTERVRAAAEKVVGPEKIRPKERTMGGEDFAFFTRRKPCMAYQIGTQNDDPRSALPLHNPNIIFDEACFGPAMGVMVQFVLDNQNGIQF